MNIAQYVYSENNGWQPELSSDTNKNIQLILLFGSTELIKNQIELNTIKKKFTRAIIYDGSTDGENNDTKI